MSRNKRKLGWDASDKEDSHSQPKPPKVPALTRVIVEALQKDSLQKFCSSLEPIIRRTVSEEVERALAKLGPCRIGRRCSPEQIEGPDGRNLQLQFRTRLSLPIFTGGEIEGEEGAVIHIALLDANTGSLVTSGPEASAKLDVLVLDGDFSNEDNDSWTEDEFERHVVKEREGKRPLLTGELQVSLKEGMGTLGKITFTDNSSWKRSRKFRIGLKVASGCCKGTRIREAKTEAFMVKERRGQVYKKHYPPALEDAIWRLENIRKDGSFHMKLNNCGIQTVGDFLKFRDQGLRNILGSGMSDKMWKKLVEHADTAVFGGKHYVYYLDETRNGGAIFNSKYEFCGLIDGGQFNSAACLNDSRQKGLADIMVKKAYDNWTDVIIYHGKDLLNIIESGRAAASGKETLLASADCSSSYDLQDSQKHLEASVPNSEQCSVMGDAAGGGFVSAGYDENQATIYSNHPQNADSNSHMLYESTSFTSPNLIVGSTHETQVTMNDPAPATLFLEGNTGFQPFSQAERHADPSTSDVWSQLGIRWEDELLEGIHALLESKDMQDALLDYRMDGASTSCYGGIDFSSPSPCPDFSSDHEQNRTSSGSAAVGWLKITKIMAALRWAFFIRKKVAARRRARLVELED